MSNIKSISSLTMLVLLGLSVLSDARADSARSMCITKLETSVFLKSEGELAREYRVPCITGATHDVVRFRIAPLANNK